MSDSRIEIHAGDITKLQVGAIVNAANEQLAPGGGVCGAIHHAGGPEIWEECKAIVRKQGPLPTGHAVATTAGRMKTRYVVHTVGPVWHGGKSGEPQKLASCYRESIRVADELNLNTIAFPSISTGIFGYPVARATQVAVDTVSAWLAENDGMERVIFCVFGDEVERTYRRALGR